MNNEKIKAILQTAGSHIFHVTFVKKNGDIREMTCKLGVVKHLKGGASTTAHKTNLLTVFDMNAKGYRSVNLDTVISAKIDGAVIKFRDKEEVKA